MIHKTQSEKKNKISGLNQRKHEYKLFQFNLFNI